MTVEMFTGFQPGDCLLYGSKDLFGIVTNIKTWSPAAHVEVYAGNGESVASRNGIGVNIYPLRTEQLIAVLRPNKPVDLKAGMVWFWAEACGQGYDFLGLLCFTLAVKQGSPNKMFCSEFEIRFYRACQFHVVHPEFDADKVAPGSNFMSANFDWVWVEDGVTP